MIFKIDFFPKLSIYDQKVGFFTIFEQIQLNKQIA